MYLDALEFQQLEQASLGSILGGDSIVPSRPDIVKTLLPSELRASEGSTQYLGVG
jgi:hypothetical protein